MDSVRDSMEYDVIVVGSGVGGATVARELSLRGRRVLVLERGVDADIRENLFSMARSLATVPVADGLAVAKADVTGGTTTFYFGVADPPPVDTLRGLGVDIASELEETRRELPVATLSDALLGARTARIRDSARALGYDWKKREMLVDEAKAGGRYSADAKWTARAYLREAIARGATLVDRARVLRVLVDGTPGDGGRAIGVEYERTTGKDTREIRRAHGAKVVLAAGSAVTPLILRESGLGDFSDSGFYCHPSFVVFGLARREAEIDNFGGAMGVELEEGIMLGDANFCGMLHRALMLGNGKFLRMFQRSRSLGVGVMVRDALGGGIGPDGRFHKTLRPEDKDRMARGEAMAREIVAHAGGGRIFRSQMGAAHLGGVVRIGEHLDADLRAGCDGLYVCDGSIVPPQRMVSPTLTLVCLGKYAAKRLDQGL